MDAMVFVGPIERAYEIRRMPGVADVKGAWALPDVGDGLVVYLSGTSAEVTDVYNRLSEMPGLTVGQKYVFREGV